MMVCAMRVLRNPQRFADLVPRMAQTGGAIVVGPRGTDSKVTPHLLSYTRGRGLPLRAPHHTVSKQGMVKEIQLASRGILFLDEIDQIPFRNTALAELKETKEQRKRSGLTGPVVVGVVTEEAEDGAIALNAGRVLSSAYEIPLLQMDAQGSATPVGHGAMWEIQKTQAPAGDLELINRHRKRLGMSPLDPEKKGWSPEDVHTEAQRIRALQNPWVDQIPGGLADRYTPADFDPVALAEGIEVEREHAGDNTALATEIAMDHLVEDKEYYRKLRSIHLNPEHIARIKARMLAYE